MTAKPEQIDAEQFLRVRGGSLLLDVRAELEFAEGHCPGSHNLPILTNEERHLVGIEYKQKGQPAALRLAESLLVPSRERRIESWRHFLLSQPGRFLTCFRGGLRSETAQRWLAEAGCEALRIRGGSKALRRVFLAELERPLRGYVICGLTGSGKTRLLRSLGAAEAIDLEALAGHRGSAFGSLFLPDPQPTQQNFENRLAHALLRARSGGKDPRFLFEDESRLIGQRVIPGALFDRMRAFPRIVLECPAEERARNLLKEYVTDPLRLHPREEVCSALAGAVRNLKNRLGGLAAGEIEAQIHDAFRSASQEAQLPWIRRLLAEYYDRLYRHGMSRAPEKPAFRGSAAEIREWLRAPSEAEPCRNSSPAS